jgi:hypothetical protein
MTDRGDVLLDARMDRSLVWVAGGSVRYVAVRLTGVIRADQVRPSRPHNLALALDVSRRGGREALEAAKAISAQIVRRLSDQDRLAIVAMSRIPKTVFATSAMDAGQREKALAALTELKPGHDLNLSDGWLAAAEAVAEHLEDDEAHSRVILLAASSPTHGTSLPENLAAHARDLRAHQIFTTVAGIGLQANAALLAAMDDNLGRRVLVTRTAHDIAEAVIHGSLELGPLVADDVTVRLTCRPDVEVELLNPAAAHQANGHSVRLDSLRAGEVVNLVFKLKFPMGSEQEEVPVTVDASWCHPQDGHEARAAQVSLGTRFAHDRFNTHQPRDWAATEVVALAWHAAIIGRILELSRENGHREARAYLNRELTYFQRYCEGFPMADILRRSLRRALDSAYRPWRAQMEHDHPPGHGP